MQQKKWVLIRNPAEDDPEGGGSGLIVLKYGNTNTFFLPGGLLIDTDYAGTLSAFYKTLKANGLKLSDISYVLATHYHPDHCGLIGLLQGQGVKLILLETQRDHVHYSDYIFQRDGLQYVPVDESKAEALSFDRGRGFLQELGVAGEIISTPSHSPDSVSIMLDNGDCLVGDLQPREYVASYETGSDLQKDWDRVMSYNVKRIFYAHAPAAQAK